ncbi:excinuclease ABC subunit UvrC [Anaplasma marginale]|uniref:UvrABC system protein C n=1 Tax=Anaplasma marginale (strain Florida) TaxID=320483 RepID=B9KI41_ANAMF|nr:excinuclease ABC subunit UvrC [Anaplasma marginale]ACM49153.1 excinuclease ABC subunit C (uvrC) [Anaplasma marginale str. Florida]RCL20250.1 excinuclease ABC subunit UvrC [Anaplasma marginale]
MSVLKKNLAGRLLIARDAVKKALNSIPCDVAGVYKMLGANGLVLYVGKAKDLKKRLRSYYNFNQMSDRILAMVGHITELDVIVTQSEAEALLLEAQLIKTLKPKYNIIMRDDKFYPYILLSKHEYPRIVKYRGRKEAGLGKCYGPFISSLVVKLVISALRKAFQLRSCSDNFFASRDRPCIEYEMRNCSAPCTRKISEEDYAKSVHMAHKVLTGKSKELQRELFDSMRKFSDNLDYESAMVYRDRLQALKSIQECVSFQTEMSCDADFVSIYGRSGTYCLQVISFRGGISYGSQPYFVDDGNYESESDVLGMFMLQVYSDPPGRVYVDCESDYCEVINAALEELLTRKVDILTAKSHEELKFLRLARNSAMEALNRRLRDKALPAELEELAELFGLPNPPERIEVYDNSHISGTHPFGVMVVCGKDGLLRKEYRKFKIQTVLNGDDYSMMHEVLFRRFSEESPSVPDFVLIDGGRGHISSAIQVLGDLGIPFACMAKGSNRNAGEEVFYLPDGRKICLDPDSKLMLYMRKIRDEAHRFAITSHRSSRDRTLSSAVLCDIPGVGSARRRALITYFGSIDGVKRARTDEISKVPGISIKLAQRIYAYLKQGMAQP